MPNYQKIEELFKKENVPYDRFKTGTKCQKKNGMSMSKTK
jgi:hypothetical protein